MLVTPPLPPCAALTSAQGRVRKRASDSCRDARPYDPVQGVEEQSDRHQREQQSFETEHERDATQQGGNSPYPRSVIEVGRRRRNQPAPPHAVFEALVSPNRDPARHWLKLAADEQPPRILETSKPDLVVWSSLWDSRPDAVIRFELPLDPEGQGTDLTWTLLIDEPEPEPPLLGHLRKRINVLINAELRYSFGQ